eukprot:11540586-Alexandrium_andersonii.AAC.1
MARATRAQAYPDTHRIRAPRPGPAALPQSLPQVTGVAPARRCVDLEVPALDPAPSPAAP